MKIAFINIYQGKVERGAERFVEELSKRLKKRYQVNVFASNVLSLNRWPILWRFYLDPQGLQVFWFTLLTVPALWRGKYDIIVPINGGWQPALIRILTWLYGGKMVITGQSGKGWDDRNNLWSFPDRFVALSNTLKVWAKKACPFVKSVCIPNGVDIKKFKPEGEKDKLKLERPIILCVGALMEGKRLDLAIKAVSRLNGGSLVVAGDGLLKNELQKLGENLLGKRFLLKKYSFEKMPQVYRSADIFTLPSPSYRAFEIVLVEAMASGLPVVANNDFIRAEIVGDGGILVDPTDIDAYAKELNKALMTKWGQRPRRQAEKYSWDGIAKRYEKLFESLVK